MGCAALPDDRPSSAAGSSGAGHETIRDVGRGGEAYNLKLSKQRAEAVKAYLVGKGIEPRRLQAVGKGEADPVVQCDEKDRAALIKCLEPNRRVEVEQITVEVRR